MRRVRSSIKRRTVGVLVSIGLILALLFTGTFAFVMPFQHRSNEFVGGGIRYDATLNEDFSPVVNWTVRDAPVVKRINVTNTGNNERDFGGVFVRIQLREFMEIYDTFYRFWGECGIISFPQEEMESNAALFMIDSNNLVGNTGSVFVIAPAPTRETMTEAQARAQIYEQYQHLFPDGIDEHSVVFTTDFVSGLSGWFVVSRENDPNGQYGRPMVADIIVDTTNPTLVGSDTPRAVVNTYGIHGPNGECLYDIHRWNGILNSSLPVAEGDFAAPTSNYREWIEWTLGVDVILLSEWDGEPVDAWIIDDGVASTQGWVYWGRELMVGETTANFLETVRLIEQPDGDFYYVIHVHMYHVAFESLDTWTDMPIAVANAFGWSTPSE